MIGSTLLPGFWLEKERILCLTFFRYEYNDRFAAIQGVLNRLPKPNFDNLAYVIKFLRLLSQYSEHNKMSSSNIAIVIGPNLLWAPNDG